MIVLRKAAGAGTALMLSGAVVLGGPLALSRFGRLDALTGLAWPELVTTADDGTLVLGVITVIGWLAWALATLSLVSELLAAFSHQRWRLRIPGISLFAPASSVLVTAIVGLVASQAVTPVVAHAAPGQPPAPQPAVPGISGDDTQQDRISSDVAKGRDHLVQPGDDLWSLAERYYQDGSRWREIAAANESVLLQSTDYLTPGMLLAIPNLRASADDAVMVEPGDTLTGLATEYLGDPARWPEIAEANSGLIDEPDAIDVGWVLRLPAAQPVTQSDSSVQPGPASQPGLTAPVKQATEPGSFAVPEEPASVASSSVPESAIPAHPGPQRDTSAGSVHQSAPAMAAVSTQASAVTSCPVPVDQPSSAGRSEPAEPTLWRSALPSWFATVLAAGLAAAYALRRRQQLAARPLGRRLPPLSEATAVTSAALSAAQHDAPRTDIQQSATCVPLGDRDGETIWCEVERNAVTWLQGSDGEDVAVGAHVALALTTAAPEAPITVVAAGPEFSWMTTLDEPRLQVVDQVADAWQVLDEVLAERASNLPDGMGIDQLRADPTFGEAWAPFIVITAHAPESSLPVALSMLGASLVICGGSQPAPSSTATVVIDGERAQYLPTAEVFRPHVVTPPARRVLTELFETANLTEYPSAPWWDETPDAELPVVLRVAAWPGTVEELPVATTIESEHPMLRLLGPVELVGARGPVPPRAIKQCEEYCAWLLENPGASAGTMTRALMIADPTRRSNLSRLRTWLGADDQGAPYLPDAYSGRIKLHPGVTSDWEQMQLCLSAGVNRVSDATLIEALGLVRGAPLADAAPGQWHWAEQLRADISATIRDAAVVLSRRALTAGDLEHAQWAVETGLLANPDDELLLGVQIRIADANGDRALVDQLVLRLTRRARMLGIDLADETVTLLQEVVEGRARLRRA